ncbi:MAG: transaldolase family protein [Dehalococcoidia bacterium]|nr:transaldolase family protein [Dehalococcoidia bacterium]MCL2149978.1 transaldolase family protein [Dehalococcoidia bacterium]
MKLFLDTANLEQIKQGVKWGVSGVTTNPTLVAAEGVGDYKTLVRAICDIVPGEVSAEVTVEGAAAMIAQGREIAAWHDNVVVKVPCTPDGFEVASQLGNDGIKVNMTLCFSASQALLAALCGAYFISPFMGRLDDIGQDGLDLLAEIVDIYDKGSLETRVLAASVRHPGHVLQAASLGAYAATIPFKVLEQLARHPLTDSGNARFLADWHGRAAKKA